MKLNYKRTIFVGFAFFLICSFWQAYDNTIPLILTNKFGMSQAWSGVIMALDNVLALFMLPLFGAISDKHRGKRGRRTPFIVVGTLIAAVMLIALSFVDNAQLRHLSDVSAIDDPAALEQIYDRQANETLLTPSGDKFVLSQKFTQEEFIRIRSQVEQDGKTVTNPDYTNYVVPARQACAWDATAKSPATAGILHRSAADRPGFHGRVPLPGGGPDARRDPEAPAQPRPTPSSTSWALPAAFWCWLWAWCSPPPPSATP